MPGDFRNSWRVTTGRLVRRSRYLVDLPAEMQPTIKEQNLTFPRQVTRANGRAVYLWATAEVQPWDREPFAADSNGVVQTIEVAAPLHWDDIARWFGQGCPKIGSSRRPRCWRHSTISWRVPGPRMIPCAPPRGGWHRTSATSRFRSGSAATSPGFLRTSSPPSTATARAKATMFRRAGAGDGTQGIPGPALQRRWRRAFGAHGGRLRSHDRGGGTSLGWLSLRRPYE